MRRLIVIQGAGKGREIELDRPELIVGRTDGLDITLPGGNVSRRHARFLCENQQVFVEDLKSSNGTLVNEKRITGKTLLRPGDLIRFGSYVLRHESQEEAPAADFTIQQETAAVPTNVELFRENAAQKLQAVLQLAEQLSLSLDTDTLLQRFLDQLLLVFPQAERALFVSQKDGQPEARVVKERRKGPGDTPQLSRSVMRSAFEKRLAVLAEDTAGLDVNATLSELGIRSLLCVPLCTHTGRVLGAVQLDRFQAGHPFTRQDLLFLTALSLHVATVLENAALHQELVVKERMQRDLALARDIQAGFLPTALPTLPGGAVDLHAELHPAEEVAGDFYDYLALDDRRLAFVVADVSGKGMPAALFMTMVRALLRELTRTLSSPAEILVRLNDALAQDNPRFMFVTVQFGIYDVTTGQCVLARAGHPAALVRRQDGSTSEFETPPGVLLGIERPCRPLTDVPLLLLPGDSLCIYTDGVTEATHTATGELFGTERLLRTMQGLGSAESLPAWAGRLRSEVAAFCQGSGPQDDLTLLVIRRPAAQGN